MAVVFGSLGLEPKRLKDKRLIEKGFVLLCSALNLLTFEVKWQLNHELAALFFFLNRARNLYSGHTEQRQWFWMSGASMQFNNWPSNSDPSLYVNPCGAMEGGGRHLWVEQPCEELLNFICESRRRLCHIKDVCTICRSLTLHQLSLFPGPAGNQARLYFYSSSERGPW